MLSTLLTTLLVLNTIVLIFLIIVLQQGNEGGLGGLGSGNATGFFGASGGVTTIVRATWISGFLFLSLSLSCAWLKTHERYSIRNEIEKNLDSSISAPTAPATAAPAPTAPPANSAPIAPAAAPAK